jgi:hypothetical protein
MLERPFWKQPVMQELAHITKVGRIVSHAASPTSPVADFNSKYLISNMITDVVTKKIAKQDALKSFLTQAKEIYAKYPDL